MQLASTKDVALLHHRGGIYLFPPVLFIVLSLPPIITAVRSQQKWEIRGAWEERPESAHEAKRNGKTLIRTNVKQLQEESS